MSSSIASENSSGAASADAPVVIVGAGQAAGQCAVALRGEGFQGRIVIYGAESQPPYQRPPLSKHLLAGDVGLERVFVKPADFYTGAGIELHTGRRVTAIERDAKCITLDDGARVAYGKLVLATGSRARTLDMPGADAANVHCLRTLDDMNALQAQLIEGARLVVIGGGYIGLEVASVAVRKGVDVTVLEQAERLMARVVGTQVSEFYAMLHSGQGVTLALRQHVRALETASGAGGDDHDRAVAVCCDDGSRYPADLVLVGVGITPNVELAAAAGLAVDNGIVVDEYGRSDDPDIFAIGDCSNAPCARYGRRVRLESVPNALGQARAAASMLAAPTPDAAKPHTEVPWFWSDQYDLKLQIVGFSDGYDQVVVRGDPAARKFMVCYLRDGELLAVESVGNPKEFMTCRKLVAERARPDPQRLADPDTPL